MISAIPGNIFQEVKGFLKVVTSVDSDHTSFTLTRINGGKYYFMRQENVNFHKLLLGNPLHEAIDIDTPNEPYTFIISRNNPNIKSHIYCKIISKYLLEIKRDKDPDYDHMDHVLFDGILIVT